MKRKTACTQKKQFLHGALEAKLMTDAHAGDKDTLEITDDLVLRFRTVNSNVTGRVVRLGPALDTILNRHNYPPKVTEALGQSLALVAMLGTSLKGDAGILTLQAKSDGQISLLVADYASSGSVRGYATFSDDNEAESTNTPVLGDGSLALTIDPGPEFDRYQGVVALEGQSLTEAAHTYFRQSEQLPTFVRLAVAHHYDAEAESEEQKWTWRAGGLMIQHLSREGGVSSDLASGKEDEEPPALGEDDEDWQRALHLAMTVEDHELLDPGLAPDRLLYRLFHEEGVVAFPAESVRDDCRCSRQRVHNLLRTIGGSDLDDMTDDSGKVTVTCEFCSTKYAFDPTEFSEPSGNPH